MSSDKPVRKCAVCGARVKNRNSKTVTCDPVCTKAYHAGRTRQEQIELENAQPVPERDGTGCPRCGCPTKSWFSRGCLPVLKIRI